MQGHSYAKRVFIIISALLVSFISVPQTSYAATGDLDTYLNLEANTSSSHRYAISASHSASHLTNAFTWEVWLYPTNACTSMYCHIFAKENEYVLGVVNGTFQYALNGTGGGWVWVDTTITARLNTWQHVALTRPASTAAVTFYVNGIPVYTANSAGTLATGNFADTSYNFQIGARTSNVSNADHIAAQSFIGSLDELKFWRTARTQAQIQSDMSTYGPRNDNDLQLYFDFNDVSGTTLENKASGATSSSSLTLKNSPTISSLIATSISGGNSIVRFPRTYLSANGFVLPVGVSAVSALVVGGGGGGGSNVGNGGSGGGGYLISNFATNSTSRVEAKVGTGGAGGRVASAGTTSYDGTTLIDGQTGETSTLTISASSFSGGGGTGGQTIWSNNLCMGSVENLASSVAGSGSGSGGTAYTGGLGGTRSGTQTTANGKAGFTSSITGSSNNYSGGGGSGSWSGYIQGNGANSIGGNGNGAHGVNGTGSGGGGNAAGCAVGGNGGSGLIILSFAAYSGALSVPASATFRTTATLTATLSTSGKVTFFEKGKVISTCKNVPTITSATITATCSWKPSTHGPVSLSARFLGTGAESFPSTLAASQSVVSKRTTQR
jgi:hypothetical protein